MNRNLLFELSKLLRCQSQRRGRENLRSLLTTFWLGEVVKGLEDFFAAREEECVRRGGSGRGCFET